MSKFKLKNECLELSKKTKLKVIPSKTTKGPFPLAIKLRIGQPEYAEMYDIHELIVLFVIDSVIDPSLNVLMDALENKLPKLLCNSMVDLIGKQWKSLYKLGNKDEFNSWYLDEMYEWIRFRFINLVSSVPECLEMYLGDSISGATIRRYGFVEREDSSIPENGSDNSSKHMSENENQENSDHEDDQDYWKKQKEDELLQLQIEKDREAEERRREYEMDPALNKKVQQLSKKELEAQKACKNKQGVRMRKTASK